MGKLRDVGRLEDSDCTPTAAAHTRLMGMVMETLGLSSDDNWHRFVEDLEVSRRQADICRGLTLGLSDKEIASSLGISIHTLRTHLSRLFLKFNVSGRNALIISVFRKRCELCKQKC